MKKIALVLITALLALATACTQYVFIPSDLIPGYGGGGSSASDNEADTTTIINYLQSDGFLQKVVDGGETGLSVATSVGAEAPTVSALAKTARAAGDRYWATVTFTLFSAADAGIFIEKGSVVIEFKGVDTATGLTITSADVDVTEELSYNANGRTGTFEMSYTDGPASGTITTTTGSTTFTVENLTMSTPGSATITINGDSVSMGDVGESITNGFGGGSGTPEDPYLIYNEEQFSRIYTLMPSMANEPEGIYHFEVMADLEFTDDMDSPAIGIFRGNIDFNGHTLSGISADLLDNNLSDLQLSYLEYKTTPYGVIENYPEGTLSNLVFRPADHSPLVMMTHHVNQSFSQDLFDKGTQNRTSTVTLSNITAYGDFHREDYHDPTNTSSFVQTAFQGTTIFSNCINYTSQTTQYGGAFLGGYPGKQVIENEETYYSYVTFENCINYGDITGERAGVFMGSHNTITQLNTVTTPIIKISNCANYGTITGTLGVGYYCPISNGRAEDQYDWLSVENADTGNDPEHVILLAEPSGVTYEVNNNGTFSISNSNAEYASFSIGGYTYAMTYMEGDDSSGSLVISIKPETITCTTNNTATSKIRKLQMIDSSHESVASAMGTLKTDELGNKIITIDGIDYYYHDHEATNSHVGGTSLIADLRWTLTCYNEKGYIVGQMEIK